MKKIAQGLKWACIVLLLINLLLWGLYNASGHQIPTETNVFFRNNFFLLTFILAISMVGLFFLKKKKQ
ncbi:hypothetical protein [Pedobacter chitinilyticus]|uniref:Uncharacterized protein n=1 Tax=Pedobacter chitinilyticus TaxID=2233776 RepID=A0A443YV57_9SPHI|nr:hypothetical protein [Pedobacter chitinilyticus]RWU07748.1 hypothetical protein DPV69_12270 [Pedobacter chitinilyticus]